MLPMAVPSIVGGGERLVGVMVCNSAGVTFDGDRFGTVATGTIPS